METQIRLDSYLIRYRTKTAALFHALKDGIVEGRFPVDTKLPSSRELAEHYQLSRGTVNVAYEMLHAQGYVRSEVGRGTFVVYHDLSGREEEIERQIEPVSLSAWGTRVKQLALLRSTGVPDEGHIVFYLGRVDMSCFPDAM